MFHRSMKVYGSLAAILISLSFVWVGVDAHVRGPAKVLDDQAYGGVDSTLVFHDRRGLKSDMVMEEGFGEDDEGYGLEEFSIADPMEEDFLEDEESYELEDSLEEGYEFKEECKADIRRREEEIKRRKREIKAARARCD